MIPSGQRGVAKHLLIEERQHRDGDVDSEAEHEDEQAANGEVAIAQHDMKVDQRMSASASNGG